MNLSRLFTPVMDSPMSKTLQPDLSRLRTLWNVLTQPAETVQDAHQRQQARLLSSLLLGAVFLGVPVALLPILLNVSNEWAFIHSVNGLAAIGTLLALYYLSRRANYHLAVRLIAVVGTGLILGKAFFIGGEPGVEALHYLAMTLVFAGMFLSGRSLLALVSVQTGAMLLYGWLNPEVGLETIVLRPLIFNGLMGALTLLISSYHQRIDQLHRAELVQSEERYRLISDMISDYAYAFRVNPDRSFVREWITDSFTHMTGYSRAEVQNNANLHMYHPDEREAVSRHLEAVLKGEERSDEYRVLLKDGRERWLRLSRRPVWDDEQGRVVRIYGVAQDITAQKLAQAQKFEIALAQARFDLVRQFFRAVSHDFRTSLSIIETNRYLVERLLERRDLREIPSRLEFISEQVTRLTRQLENLKIGSSLSSPVTELCDLNILIEREIQSRQGSIQRKKLRVMAHYSPTAPLVRANCEELRHAVGHLLENAINFTGEAGRIDLKVYHDEDAVKLDVQDSGVGISAKDRPHIFDFFYRGDEARSIESGGIGLGLSIVKMIAEAYGGRVTCHSQLGQGSIFTLAFPAANHQA